MRKVYLGKPQDASSFEQRHRWLLHSMHEVELASAVRDPEFDVVDARFVVIETRLDGMDTSLATIEARLDAIDATLVTLDARLVALEPP